MVTHPTRTPPKGIFHIFVSIICFTSLSGSNGDSLGRGPMEKTKKTIFGDSLGERPHGENPKNLKKPRENKKNTIFGDSWLDPPIHQDLWKIVFFCFLEVFLIFQLSDFQDLWKIVLFVSMAYVHTCRYMWHLGHLQHFRFSIWFTGALGQANCFSCASSWVFGNPATIMLHILCFIRLSTVSFILLRWDPSAMNSEHDKNIVEHLGPKTSRYTV